MNTLSFKQISGRLLPVLVAACLCPALAGQETNYDESRIPPFALPDPLVMNDGRTVGTSAEWIAQRRPEIRAFFETQMFGAAPGRPEGLHFKVLSEDGQALGGTATRREVAIGIPGASDVALTLLMYLPNSRTAPVPVFLGMNGSGNHTVHSDPGITPTGAADPSRRGSGAAEWPVEMLIERGYGLATFCCTDLAADAADAFAKGVFPLYYDRAAGQTAPGAGEWGVLAAWAWSMSRAMDYLETDADTDAARTAIVGTSRLGKAALWAGASDERFALVISNVSGCGGAALSKRRIGETVGTINRAFPYWFCGNFKAYGDHEDALPFDQHELIALIAPRAVYISSAEDDQWADPKGEFLSGVYASPVYRLFGLTGMGVAEMPPVNSPVMAGHIGYHIRTGAHGITAYDWTQFVAFADRHFKAF
jgi:hypothetical protein